MKKKSLKGFTLIECIVAMAIMGIASLLMVQVYATVAKMNSDNTKMNNSLEVQMQYAEDEITSDGGDVKVVKLSSKDTGTTKIDKVKFKITDNTKSKYRFTYGNTKDENADVDMYILSADTSTDANSAKYDDANVRYKFILPNS